MCICVYVCIYIYIYMYIVIALFWISGAPDGDAGQHPQAKHLSIRSISEIPSCFCWAETLAH